MNALGHIIMGGAFFGLALWLAPVKPIPLAPVPLVGAAVLVTVGALAPDIDHANATMSQWTQTARGKGPLGILGWLGGIFRALLGGHRGITHSIIGWVALGLLLWRFLPAAALPYSNFFMLGWFSHIFADFLTEGGVPLLLPFSAKRFGIGGRK